MKFLSAATVFLVAIASISGLNAQAILTFSGGNGSPLTITLTRSVTYTVNSGNCGGGAGAPFFIFDEAGNPFGGAATGLTGTMSFHKNADPNSPISAANSGATIPPSFTANDLYVYGLNSFASIGDTYVLSAGSVTTTGSIAGPPPAGGSFTTFVANSSGGLCTTNGVAAAPTAAGISVWGRVTTASGTPVGNALVSLTTPNGRASYARTDSFGYYRIGGATAGQTVVLEVTARRMRFAPRAISLNGSFEGGVNFTAAR